jgi:hypothetical protein
MTGRKRETPRPNADRRRYAALAHLRTPDGEPAVREDYDYITIWGFWNGPDELLAIQDGRFYQAFNAKHAFGEKMITREVLEELTRLKAERLARNGFEDLNPKSDHLLVSFGPDMQLVLGTAGKPEVRLCNFELVRRRAAAGSQPAPGT